MSDRFPVIIRALLLSKHLEPGEADADWSQVDARVQNLGRSF
jgi:hypothetical protein